MGENSSFLERLRSMEEGPVESTALEKHLGRLRKGQEWLIRTWNGMEAAVGGESQAQRFLLALDVWAGMEREARLLYGYEGCVMSPDSCGEDSPVWCEVCAKERTNREEGQVKSGNDQGTQLKMETGAPIRRRSS